MEVTPRIRDPHYIRRLSLTQEHSGKSKAVFLSGLLHTPLAPEDDHQTRQCLRHFFQIIHFVDTSNIPNKQRYEPISKLKLLK